MGYFDVALCFFSSFSALKCPVSAQNIDLPSRFLYSGTDCRFGNLFFGLCR